MPTSHFVSRKFLRVNGLSLPWNIAGRRERAVASSREGGNAATVGRSSDSGDGCEDVGRGENGASQWQRCGAWRREELAAAGPPEGVGRQDHEERGGAINVESVRLTLIVEAGMGGDDANMESKANREESALTPKKDGLDSLGEPPKQAAVLAHITETDPPVEAARDGGKRTRTSFSDRLEELRQYKIEHGHVNVKWTENKSLYEFCLNIRRTRAGKGDRKITTERIASLNALGFDWGGAGTAGKAKKSFEERLGELRQYKIEHGHVNVKKAQNNSLYQFCWRIRQAHNGKGTMKISSERIASLIALGFDWKTRAMTPRKSFEERIEELKSYKENYGHLNVKWAENKSLYQFCSHIKRARAGKVKMKITSERIASLNALGFDWGRRQQWHLKSPSRSGSKN